MQDNKLDMTDDELLDFGDFDFEYESTEVKSDKTNTVKETTKVKKGGTVKKSTKTDTLEKKPKIEKADAVEKKVNKKVIKKKVQPAEEKEASKRVKEKEASKNANKQTTSDKSEKKTFNIKPLIIVAYAVIVLIIAGCLILPKVAEGNKQHITLADKLPVETEVAEETTEVIETQNNIILREEPYEQTSTLEKLNTSDEIVIPVTVNVKLDGETEYKDCYSFITFNIKGITLGYDKVKTELDKYNEISTKDIELGTKEEFYSANAGSEIALYTVELEIPESYITTDKNNKVYVKPELKLSIRGTEEVESIKTERYVYDIPTLTDISDSTETLIKGEKYSFKWIGILPSDIGETMYEWVLDYKDDDIQSTYILNGDNIPVTDDQIQLSDTDITSETETSTEDTENENVETE